MRSKSCANRAGYHPELEMAEVDLRNETFAFFLKNEKKIFEDVFFTFSA